MLTINHNESGGTIIDGTAKGDGSAAILKTNGCAGPAPRCLVRPLLP
ncbi:hypothetical protein GS416_05500 [Rhodococcus hoagii]|nr:hypothetical protein [Prescottella equi]